MKFKSISLRKHVQRTACSLRKQNADRIAGQALRHQNSDYQLFLQPLLGAWWHACELTAKRGHLPHPCSNMTTSLSLIIINATTVIVRKEKADSIFIFWRWSCLSKTENTINIPVPSKRSGISPYNYISYILVT